MGCYTSWVVYFGYKLPVELFLEEYTSEKGKVKYRVKPEFEDKISYGCQELELENKNIKSTIEPEQRGLEKLTERDVIFYTLEDSNGFHGEIYKLDMTEFNKEPLVEELKKAMQDLLGEKYDEKLIGVYVQATCECSM